MLKNYDGGDLASLAQDIVAQVLAAYRTPVQPASAPIPRCRACGSSWGTNDDCDVCTVGWG